MGEQKFNPLDPLGLFGRSSPAQRQPEEGVNRIERATIQSGLPESRSLREDLNKIERRLKELRGSIAATSQAFTAGTPGRMVWERRTLDISQALDHITDARLKVGIIEADFQTSPLR